MAGKKPLKATALAEFGALLADVKNRIQMAQTRAILAVNSELVRLYWDIGRIIDARQKREGWGAAVIPRLAAELKNELPELKGFSERNIKRMLAFYRDYPEPSAIVPQTAAQLQPPPTLPQPAIKSDTAEKVPQPVAQLSGSLLWLVPWAHHAILMDKMADLADRRWYMEQTLANGWSRNVLAMQIEARAHSRQGKARSNFALILPEHQSDLVQQALKDPYLFDFLTLTEPFHERELETELVRHLEKFLLELGQGFAFVGRQVHLEFSSADYYLDLLFYHLKLRYFVVVELNAVPFQTEFTGKLNMYMSAVDDLLRHPDDKPTIGLLLCKGKERIVAEYALTGFNRPIGVADWKVQLTETLPKELKGSLPTVEEIEAELAEVVKKKPKQTGGRKKKGGAE